MKPISALLIIVSLSILSCNSFDDPPSKYTYKTPAPSDRDMQVSTLGEEGINELAIEQLTDQVVNESFPRVDAMLIARNGKLVYENYFHGYERNTLHNLYSAGKSITAILTGIAIDKGFIKDVHTPVVELLPEYSTYFNDDPRKVKITIEHLLNMTSGLGCDDWNQHTEDRMQASHDWIKYILSLPMTNDPGSTASYCTGGAVILGRIIENQSHMPLQEFAAKYLFQPLGITESKWTIMPDNHASAGGLFFLRPLDIAKIGQLLLNLGKWNDVAIVSEQWVEKCLANQTHMDPFEGYGYLWWKQTLVNNTTSVFANGNGGQFIFVIPSENLVVIFTGGNKNTSVGLQCFKMMNQYILPALQR